MNSLTTDPHVTPGGDNKPHITPGGSQHWTGKFVIFRNLSVSCAESSLQKGLKNQLTFYVLYDEPCAPPETAPKGEKY